MACRKWKEGISQRFRLMSQVVITEELTNQLKNPTREMTQDLRSQSSLNEPHKPFTQLITYHTNFRNKKKKQKDDDSEPIFFLLLSFRYNQHSCFSYAPKGCSFGVQKWVSVQCIRPTCSFWSPFKFVEHKQWSLFLERCHMQRSFQWGDITLPWVHLS